MSVGCLVDRRGVRILAVLIAAGGWFVFPLMVIGGAALGGWAWSMIPARA